MFHLQLKRLIQFKWLSVTIFLKLNHWLFFRNFLILILQICWRIFYWIYYLFQRIKFIRLYLFYRSLELLKLIWLARSCHDARFVSLHLMQFFFYFKMIICKNCLKVDDNLMKTINFICVWIVDFAMSSSILNSSLYLTSWFTMKIESIMKLKVVTSKSWTFFVIDEFIWISSLKNELIMTLIIIMKIFYDVLRDLLTNRLFNNILNIIVNKFNESFFHFSFFENVTLWCLITFRRSEIYIRYYVMMFSS